MSDGKVVIETDLDSSGVESGLSRLQGTITKGIAAIGIGKIFSEAVKTGVDFEAQMSRVKAISGATGEEFAKLNEQAKQLGADTAFSATEAAQGMENLASAGFSTSEIIAAMPGMLDLAASSGEDLASSADIAASTLRGFGLEASSAGHVADVLAKNAAATNAAVADTGEAMKYVAPVAKSMGIEFEETAAAIGIMADAGIKGSQAGTTLRGALSRIAKPTKVMRETMDELGLSFYDSNGKMKSLAGITEMLETKMSGLTDEQRNQALITLFGQESLSGMMALMDRGSGEVRKLTDEYRNCDGSAKDMAKTMQDNLSGAVEEFGGSVESLGLEIYENIEGPLKKAVGVGTTQINKLTKAVKDNKIEEIVPEEAVNTVKNLGKITGTVAKGGVKALGAATGTLVENLDALIPLTTAYFGAMGAYKVFQQASAGVKTLTTAYQGLQAMEKANAITLVAQQGGLTGLQTVMGVLTGKVSAATAATGLFSKACTLAGGPVGLAVVAVGALTAGLAAYAISQDRSTSAETKFSAELRKSTEDQKKYTAELENNRKKREEAIKSAAAEGVQAEFLEQKLESLMSVEKKSAGQKQQIETIVKRLNELVPELGLAYDSEKDKLNKSTEAIKKNISAQKELAIAKAYAKQMESVSEDIVDTEIKLAEATDKQTEAQERLTNAKKKTQKAMEEYYDSGAVAGSKEEKVWKKAQQEQNKAKGNYESATQSVDKYQGELDKLNGELDELGEAHSNQEAFATFKQNLDDLAKEAGIKAEQVPKSIGEGIKKGIYSTPETGEELTKLINLDKLIQKANKEGIEVTKSVSDGIVSGKYEIPKSVDQLESLVSFDKIVQRAEKEGVKVPKSVSSGILSDQYEVPKSVDQLQNLVKFDSIATKATEAGVKIPKSISQGIMSGQYAVPQSVEQMKALVSYDSLVQQAGQKGYQIPEYLSNGVRTGNTKPSTAVNEMKALIQFNDLVTKASNAGYKIPDSLQKQVSSGKTKPKDAVQQMKNLISFNDLLSKSSAAGRNVPKNIQQAVMAGRMSPKQAVATMNNLMTTEADKAPAKMKKSGEKSGKNYGSGVGSSSNKSTAKKSGKSLTDNAKKGADSDDLYDEGSNAGSGFVNGIGSWLGKAFNAGWNLVKNAISGGKSAQKSHSPAKEWIKEGGNSGAGYVIGMERSFKPVNKAAGVMVGGALAVATKLTEGQGSQIGRAFSSNLSREISTIDLTPELRAMAKKFANTKLNLPVLNAEMRSAMESQPNRIATSKQGKIYQIMQSVGRDDKEMMNNETFDYKQLAQELANALDGTAVKMDGEKVGDLIVPRVDSGLGKKTIIVERGG